MDWLLLLGRIAFTSNFILAGLGFHIRQREVAVGYARSQGAPWPEVTVVGSGIAQTVAGAMIVLGIWVDLAALVLLVNALAFAYWMHAFWKLEDPMMRANQQAHFMKNVMLAGGALVLFYLFQQFGDDIGLTAGDPALFD